LEVEKVAKNKQTKERKKERKTGKVKNVTAKKKGCVQD